MIFDYSNFIGATIEAIGFAVLASMIWCLFFAFVKW